VELGHGRAGVTRQIQGSSGSYETYDAQARYSGIRHVALTLGVKNITDRNPPYTNSAGQFAAGYDIAYADVRGRFVYGNVRYTFR
jgi:iron complex outermembrane receptor protein